MPKRNASQSAHLSHIARRLAQGGGDVFVAASGQHGPSDAEAYENAWNHERIRWQDIPAEMQEAIRASWRNGQ